MFKSILSKGFFNNAFPNFCYFLKADPGNEGAYHQMQHNSNN